MKSIKIRVRNQKHSEVIQKMLFAIGCHWGCHSQRVEHYDESFLFVHEDGSITYAGLDDKDYFNSHRHTEVDFDWLLPDTIEIEGRTYNKDEVLARLATLKPIGEY